ncbi:MAG TPA: hypothetical protein VJV04_02200 [Nitrospiraceae bacterium]|nr:hypothetical protein [Nitrospiraceae bacterium]
MRGNKPLAKAGGLILSSAPTDLADWQRRFKMARRERDLILFGPKYDHTFNMVDFLVRELKLDAKEIAKAVTTIGEAMDNDNTRSGGGEGDKFWPIKVRQTMETSVEIVRQAEGEVSMPRLHEFIVTAAQSQVSINSPEWQAKFHNQCFAKSHGKWKNKIEQADWENGQRYWLSEWVNMDAKPRSGIEAGVTGILHVFNSGVVRSLVSEPSTITPKVMDEGKWVFVDMSVGQYGSSGAFVLNAWRYATQKYVISRDPATWVNPIICWADEAGKIVNSADSFYLTESRKFGGASVFLSQSVQNFSAAIPGERGRAMAELLTGCFSTRIIHACDTSTAEFASKALGQELKIHYGWSPPKEQSAWKLMRGYCEANVNAHQHMAPVLESREFMHGLRTGGPPHCVADAIVLRTGLPFSTGQSYMKVAFKQR